jgi:hypothetical protein
MISVCVPYFNRPQMLAEMFAEQERLYPDMDLQFSVCDDGSDPAAVVPDGVRLTRLPRKTHALNPCVPINRAVDASTRDAIVLTCPEIQHRQPVLPEMLGLLQHEDDYVIARCRHEGSTNAGVWLAGPEPGQTMSDVALPPGGGLNFLAMLRRSLWLRAGGFDEDYRNGGQCEDNDWLWRVYEAGARFRYTQGVVWHRREGPRLKWPASNRAMWERKWPVERRRALVQRRTREAA